MKVGILTLHRAHNFGAVLQALALHNTLRDRGHDVSVIDYVPARVYGYYDYRVFSRPLGLRSAAAKMMRYPSNRRRWTVFSDFAEACLHLTEPIRDAAALRRASFPFDAYICGSDQVWNPNITGPELGAYFLDFVRNGRKIAYAASYGDADAAMSRREEIGRYLADFTAVSVREREGVAITRFAADRRAVVLCDPVLLFPGHAWDAFQSPFPLPPAYMLAYVLGDGRPEEPVVRAAAARLGLPVVCLGARLRGMPSGSRYLRSAGPREFLYATRRARCVCTNSFHGACFSVLYGKAFVTLQRETRNSRLSTALDTLGLRERLLPPADSDSALLEYLRTPCQVPAEILARQREQSLAFLDDALRDR